MLWATLAQAQNAARLSVRLSSGGAQLTLFAPVGTSWEVQYSQDLISPVWTPFTNVTVTAAVFAFADPQTPLDAIRFYRAMELQNQTPTNVIVTNMVWMVPGTFVMGSPATETDRQADETQHTVTLTQGFYIGKFLVTQADYLSVASNNPSFFNGASFGTDLSRPVETVYWFSAVNYCSLLTQREQAAGHLPTNWVYRLPTEAEWEYACRAGTTTAFSYGDDPTYVNLPNYAWFLANSTNITHEIGLKLPNPAGLFDMHGDVYEWCSDWYGAYPTGAVTDPQGPNTGTTRVFRGGSWQYSGGACRSAGRYQAAPTSRYNFLGFRVVVAPM